MRLAILVLLILFLSIILSSMTAYTEYSALRKTIEEKTYSFLVIDTRAYGVYDIYWFKPINGSYLFVIGESSIGKTYLLLNLEGKLIYKNLFPLEYRVKYLISISASSKSVSIIYSQTVSGGPFYLCIIDISTGNILVNKELPRTHYTGSPKTAVSNKDILVYSTVTYSSQEYRLIIHFEKIGSKWNYTLDLPTKYNVLLLSVSFIEDNLFIQECIGSMQQLLILNTKNEKPVITHNISYTSSRLSKYCTGSCRILYSISPNHKYLAISLAFPSSALSVVLDIDKAEALYYTEGIGDWYNEYYVSNGIFYDSSGTMMYYYGYSGYLTIVMGSYLITFINNNGYDALIVHKIIRIDKNSLTAKLVGMHEFKDLKIQFTGNTVHVDKENHIVAISSLYDTCIYLLRIKETNKSLQSSPEYSRDNNDGSRSYDLRMGLEFLFLFPITAIIVSWKKRFTKALLVLSLIFSATFIPLLSTSNNTIKGPSIPGTVVEAGICKDGFLVIYKDSSDKNYYLTILDPSGSSLKKYLLGDKEIRYAGYIGEDLYIYNISKLGDGAGSVLQLYVISNDKIIHKENYESMVLKSIYGSNILLEPVSIRIINNAYLVSYTGINGSATILFILNNNVRKALVLNSPVYYGDDLVADYFGTIYVFSSSKYMSLSEKRLGKPSIILRSYKDIFLSIYSIENGLASSIHLLSLSDSKIIITRLFPVVKATMNGVEYVDQKRYYSEIYSGFYIDDEYAIVPYYDMYGEYPVIGVAKIYFDGRTEYVESPIQFKPFTVLASCNKDRVLFTLYDPSTGNTHTYILSLGDTP